MANQFTAAKMRLKTVCVVLLILSYVVLRGSLAKDLEDRGGQNHNLIKVHVAVVIIRHCTYYIVAHQNAPLGLYSL